MQPPKRIKYPFKEVGEGKVPDHLDLPSMRPDVKSGRNDGPPPKELQAHIEREKGQARSAGIKVDPEVDKLMHGYAAKGTSPSAAIDYVIKLAQRGTSRVTLERAQAVINEVAWTPEGARHLQEVLTQELVNELIGKGRE